MTTPLISIVVPCFNEAESLGETLQALATLVRETTRYRIEVIAVDDGSSDSTLEQLRAGVAEHPFLRVISFSRNFGSHAALCAGFEAARGDAVTYLPADLQDPPELSVRLADAWQGGAELVWAQREVRGDSALTRLTSRLAHALVARLSGLELPAAGLDVFLADREVVAAVLPRTGRNTSIMLSFFQAGFRSAEVTYTRGARLRGQSKWTFRKRVGLLLNMIAGSSSFPLRAAAWVGAAFLLISLAGGIYAASLPARGLPLPGTLALLVALFLIGGTLQLSLGAVGEYLWRIFDEARELPRYLVRERIEPPAPDPGDPPA